MVKEAAEEARVSDVVPEMVRRVAEAISAAQHFDDGMWVDYVAAAETVLDTLREPTDAMRLAAYEAVETDDRWDIADDVRWAKSFSAAIDAALSDTQSKGSETP